MLLEQMKHQKVSKQPLDKGVCTSSVRSVSGTGVWVPLLALQAYWHVKPVLHGTVPVAYKGIPPAAFLPAQALAGTWSRALG